MATGGTDRVVKGLGAGQMQWIAPFQLVDESGNEMFGVTSAGTVTGIAIAAMASGTVGAPGLSFTADTDTGFYRIGANNLGVAAAGAKVLDVSATGLGVVGTVLSGDGAVGAPAVSFTSDPDSGMYRIGANNVGVAVNGAKVLDVATTGMAVTGVLSATSTVTSSGAFTASAAVKLAGIETGLTAHSGGGQGSALALDATKVVHEVTTAAAGDDSVALPASAGSGQMHLVKNSAAANSVQVFGAGTDTIDGVATGTGVAVAAGKSRLFVDVSAGNWASLLGA
jgi:hypothetical protein